MQLDLWAVIYLHVRVGHHPLGDDRSRYGRARPAVLVVRTRWSLTHALTDGVRAALCAGA